jgi:hypothetical protein
MHPDSKTKANSRTSALLLVTYFWQQLIFNMRVTFAKNTVSVTVKYACKCGHKFTRKNSDWFTINPYNTKSAAECRDEIKKEQSIRKRNCPKCSKECKPL